MLKYLGIETNVDENSLEVVEKKPRLVKYVLEIVNKYITPFVTPEQDDDDEVSVNCYHDHSDGYSLSDDARSVTKTSVMSAESPINKSTLQDSLVTNDCSDKWSSRTLSDMPSSSQHNKMDLRRSYSEGAAPGDAELDNFDRQRAIRESGSLYAFVSKGSKKSKDSKDRQLSRQKSRQTSNRPVSTVIEEVPSQLHADAEKEQL